VVSSPGLVCAAHETGRWPQCGTQEDWYYGQLKTIKFLNPKFERTFGSDDLTVIACGR